jgi:hypothetical protein
MVAFGALITVLLAAGAARHQVKSFLVQLYQRGVQVVPPGYDILPAYREAPREVVEPAFRAGFGNRLGPWLLDLALAKGWRYQMPIEASAAATPPATAGSLAMTMPAMPLVKRLAHRHDLGRGGGGGGHGHGGNGHGWGPRASTAA